jgi:hypothetical protein
MAIRPVDLQLAYLATPQTAAIAGQAESAPQVAQQAAKSAFADQVREREETIEESSKLAGTIVRRRGDGEGGANAHDREEADDDGDDPDAPPHFIDVTA